MAVGFLRPQAPASEAFVPALRDLLGDPRVAVPFFGRPASAAMIDRYLLQVLTQAGMRADAFLLAVGPDETLRGAASIFRGSLSFFVAPSHWGQGIAQHLVARLCLHADDADPGALLTAMVYRENVRSRRVVEAAGFSFRGLHDPRASAYARRAMLCFERRPGRDRLGVGA